MLTLQQAELPPAPAPAPTAPPLVPTVTLPTVRPKMMIAPVIPEDMPLQCTYNSDDQAWHCSYAHWFRQPAIYTVAMIGILGFGLGFLIAAFPPVREAVKTAKGLSPI